MISGGFFYLEQGQTKSDALETATSGFYGAYEVKEVIFL